MQEGFDYLEKITDIKTLIICIAICMVFSALIFLINKSFFGMCKYISIPGIIDGILILSLGLVLYSTLPGIVEQSFVESGISYELFSVPVEKLLAGIKKLTSTLGFITIFVSLVLCVTGFVFGRKKSEVQTGM